MMYNETVNVARSMGMPTNDGTDAENRMVIESRYKWMAMHRRHLKYLTYVQWVWVVVYASYLGSLYIFTRDAPSQMLMFLCAMAGGSAYLTGQVAGNRVGRGERTTIIIFTILNVFLGAFLFQATYVLNFLLREDRRIYYVLAQALLSRYIEKNNGVKLSVEEIAFLMTTNNQLREDPVFLKYASVMKNIEFGILVSGIMVFFIVVMNGVFLTKDSRENDRDQKAWDDKKARDQEAKAKANEKLLGDGGAAKESEKGGDGGDDNAGGDAGEEEERAMEEAAEAAAAGRKPSKYRRAKKDN